MRLLGLSQPRSSSTGSPPPGHPTPPTSFLLPPGLRLALLPFLRPPRPPGTWASPKGQYSLAQTRRGLYSAEPGAGAGPLQSGHHLHSETQARPSGRSQSPPGQMGPTHSLPPPVPRIKSICTSAALACDWAGKTRWPGCQAKVCSRSC